MSGMLWAVLGTALGLMAPVLFRLWQRNGADRSAGPPGTGAPRTPPGRRESLAVAQRQSQAPAGLNRKLSRKFHGVSVKPGQHACAAVHALADQRYLPDEVPALPLAACDLQKCQCTLSHHGDRRDREDRRSGWGTYGGFLPTIPGGNRRAKARERRGRA
jgi:hypothetical protein